MQPPQGHKIRDAVASLIAAAMSELAERDGSPLVGSIADLRHWWRYGQETFVALRPDGWDMPEYVTVAGWLDMFPEMTAVRREIAADPVMRIRLDTMVGTEFSLQQRRLDCLLIEHVLEPMIVAARSYDFDAAEFDLRFGKLDTGLRPKTIRFVEFVPLNGFVSNLANIALPDGLALRPMTDRQISRAIQVQAVPAEFNTGPNSVNVSRFHQWAVMREEDYLVRSYKDGVPEHPRGPNFPSLDEPAQRLVTALRIVCGGSVVATRPIHAPRDDDSPLGVEGGASLSVMSASDIGRPTLLLTDAQLDSMLALYEMLATPPAREDRSLQVALRRFVLAGSKALTEDRLIDFVICCEALFLKRNGIGGMQKGAAAAANAGELLAGDPVLGVPHTTVEQFVTAAYRLRNAEVHGDVPVQRSMTLLHGETTEDLARLVEDLQLLVGRAVHLILGELVRSATSGAETR